MVFVQTLRNGARKMHTAPPQHPTQIVSLLLSTQEICCGGLKHATGAASSWMAITPPCATILVITNLSNQSVRCALVVGLPASKTMSAPETGLTSLPDAVSHTRTCQIQLVRAVVEYREHTTLRARHDPNSLARNAPCRSRPHS